MPGVESAAYARVTPLGYGSFSSTPIAVDGYQPPLEEQPTIEYNQVGPAYFATLGIPLVSGRDFTRADDENAPLVAIVNRTMKARYWARPGSRRTAPAGERQVGASHRRGCRFQVREHARGSKALLLRASFAGFHARARFEYPDDPAVCRISRPPCSAKSTLSTRTLRFTR